MEKEPCPVVASEHLGVSVEYGVGHQQLVGGPAQEERRDHHQHQLHHLHQGHHQHQPHHQHYQHHQGQRKFNLLQQLQNGQFVRKDLR